MRMSRSRTSCKVERFDGLGLLVWGYARFGRDFGCGSWET